MKIRHLLWSSLLWGSLSLLASCRAAPDPDLESANRAMSTMASSRILTRSCFSVVHPNGTASDFVQYLFSDLASAEWPVAFDEMEAEQMRAIGQAPLPPNVRVSYLKRQQPDSKELVLIPDDGNQAILVKGYLANDTSVAFEDEWSLGTAQADLATQHLCHSNLEMGINPYYPE